MKTEAQTVRFHQEEVQQYIRILGDLNPIYESKENARNDGFRTIPIPPAMPMTAYRFFDIPWKMQPPVIHRKQQCLNHQQMYIDEEYRGFIELSDVNTRKGFTFSKQTLFLYDEAGNLCFSGISHLVSGELR